MKICLKHTVPQIRTIINILATNILLFSFLFFILELLLCCMLTHLYVHITIPTYFVTVIHLLCYFMLCAFVTNSIKLLLLLLLTKITLTVIYNSTTAGLSVFYTTKIALSTITLTTKNRFRYDLCKYSFINKLENI